MSRLAYPALRFLTLGPVNSDGKVNTGIAEGWVQSLNTRREIASVRLCSLDQINGDGGVWNCSCITDVADYSVGVGINVQADIQRNHRTEREEVSKL